jgi:predicted TIM-barrel fold metal-dependent hydrolase
VIVAVAEPRYHAGMVRRIGLMVAVGAGIGAAVLLWPRRPEPPPGPIPKIDAHTHVAPFGIGLLHALMDRYGIAHVVNLSGMWPGHGLEEQLHAARQSGRITVFCNLDWRAPERARFAGEQVALLRRAKALGARGLKIPKGLGLGFVWTDRTPIAVDDPALDRIFEEAGALDMPVAIHTGDPKAFWQEPGPGNERYDELIAHPAWSFHGQPVPSWQELFDAYARRVARHPKTKFVGVHFGNDPEDPGEVARMLARLPNLYVDTAARVPEIGRRHAREVFERFADRILFGTDLAVGRGREDLMLGSSGTEPPSDADIERFFLSHWRYFETRDWQFDHPTPIQGRWKIDGIGLPRELLEKIYWKNAARLLGIALQSERGRNL